MTTVNATDARATFLGLLDRVEDGDEVTITRHGRPVAVLVNPGALRVRRAAGTLAAAAELHERIVEGRDRPVAGVGISEERAEELVAEVRAGRDAR